MLMGLSKGATLKRAGRYECLIDLLRATGARIRGMKKSGGRILTTPPLVVPATLCLVALPKEATGSCREVDEGVSGLGWRAAVKVTLARSIREGCQGRDEIGNGDVKLTVAIAAIMGGRGVKPPAR